MNELKNLIESFFKEVELTHLKKIWIDRLIADGFSKQEAGLWAVEIGHVINTYRSSLIRLADLLVETDTNLIPERIHNWVEGTLEDTIPVMTEPLQYLEKQLAKYLPEPDGEDEPI